MLDEIHAVFRDGAFHPTQPCALPDETEAVVFVQGKGSHVAPPGESDPDERRRIMQRLTDRMKQRTLTADAPRLTREEMHERR